MLVEYQVDRLYLFMGRELEEVSEVPAGSVCGIGGLGNAVLRFATLSTTRVMQPFYPVAAFAEPIVRVSVEPERSGALAELVEGLKLLRQADPCVRTAIDDSGAHVIVAAGEVHLERCLDDLRTRFAPGVGELRVSPPIIPFQETIVLPPKLDRTQEAIEYANRKVEAAKRIVEEKSAGGLITLRIEAFPLPLRTLAVLDSHSELLDSAERHRKAGTDTGTLGQGTEDLSDTMRGAFAEFRTKLSEALVEDWRELRTDNRSIWPRFDQEAVEGLTDQLWAFGPRKARLNLLFNAIDDYAGLPYCNGHVQK